MGNRRLVAGGGLLCQPEGLRGQRRGAAEACTPVVDPVMQLQEAQLRAALLQAQP